MCSYFFFCKQRTAYYMRISDWSSDVCSSELGAELEFRDLAEGVELRVGQHVGGRLVEAEGNEHHALRHVAVGAHVQRDLAAPRRHLHHVAGLQPHGPQLERVEAGDGLRLAAVEHCGAPGRSEEHTSEPQY